MNNLISRGCKVQTVISQSLYSNAFELFIFNTRQNMNMGVNKWLKKVGYKSKYDPDLGAAGLIYENNKNQEIEFEGEDYKLFAAMFLNEEDLHVNIIAHEVTHIALTLERNILRFVGVYDGNDGTGNAPEERLAYTIDEFMEKIIRVCIDKKVKLTLVAADKKKK